MNQRETAAARQTAGNFILLMGGLLIAAVTIAVLVAWRSTRSITRPLAEVGEVMSAVAAGDRIGSLSAEPAGGAQHSSVGGRPFPVDCPAWPRVQGD